MKVCLLSDTYPPDVGGLAVSVRRNAHALAAVGHQVHVLAPSPARPAGVCQAEADGLVSVHRLGAGSRTRETLADWFDLAVELDTVHDFALFHGFFVAYAGYVATLAARYRGKLTIDALIYRSTKGVASALLSLASHVAGVLPLRLYPLVAVFIGGCWNRISLGIPEPKTVAEGEIDHSSIASHPGQKRECH